MKKIISLLIALVLCLGAASAEVIPSKTTADMTKFEISGENLPADSGFVFDIVTVDDVEMEEKYLLYESELAVLAESESLDAYFGAVKTQEGEEINLAEVLAAEEVNVHEFWAVYASNYDEAYGDVTITMYFATPYEAEEKALVLLGIVNEAEDGAQTIEWTAYEAIGVGTEGAIEVVLTPEIILAVQNGNALMAIASK